MFDNNKLGEIRPNQLITTFGPGSIVDAVKDSVTVLDLNYWKEKGKKIIDGRLASYLGVDWTVTTLRDARYVLMHTFAHLLTRLLPLKE